MTRKFKTYTIANDDHCFNLSNEKARGRKTRNRKPIIMNRIKIIIICYIMHKKKYKNEGNQKRK